MKKHKNISASLLLTVVLTGYIFFSYQVSQYNIAQIGLKSSLLDVDNKQTWLDSDAKIKAMDLVMNSEIGFAALYPEGSAKREIMIEAGQYLLEDEYNWRDGLTPAREFLLYGSTTGVNFDELNWEKFEQDSEDLEYEAEFLSSEKGVYHYFRFKLDMESNYIYEVTKESDDKNDS